mgnify:CR=1 FL=1
MPRPAKKPPNRADGLWEVKRSFYKINGEKKRISFYSSVSYEDALAKALEYEAKLRAHILVGDILVSKEATFKEWAETWLALYKKDKVKESTYQETYERTVNSYLIPFFGERRLDSIQQSDIEALVSMYCNTYSESVMHKIELCLKAIFRTAIDNNLCRNNPTVGVSFNSNVDKKQKRTYTQQQVDIIYKYCNINPEGLYIRILLELGLRCSELCGLKWGDFDFENKRVTIRRTTTRVNNKVKTEEKTKNKKIRILPLSTDFINFLKPFKKGDDDFVLTSTKNKGKPLSPLDYSKKRYVTFFKKLQKYLDDEYKKELETNKDAKRIIMPILTPHELRHTCGTLMYERTNDIYAVSKYLGHSSVEITSKLYVHDSAELLALKLGIK